MSNYNLKNIIAIINAISLLCGFLNLVGFVWFIEDVVSLQKRFLFYGAMEAALLFLPAIPNRLFTNWLLLFAAIALIAFAVANNIDMTIKKGIALINVVSLIALIAQLWRIIYIFSKGRRKA
jgi:hypothetical protein